MNIFCPSESVVEYVALAWAGGTGYAVLHGREIAAGEMGAGYPNYRHVNSLTIF